MSHRRSDSLIASARPKAARRRVRTGCLVCRQRRRKCDELRPSCNNCHVKGLKCRYGANIVFVDTNQVRQKGPRRSFVATAAEAASAQTDDGAGNQTPAELLRHHQGRADETIHEPNAPVHDIPAHTQIHRSMSDADAARLLYTIRKESTNEATATSTISKNKEQQQNLKLLTYYRYMVAPALDLEVGSLFYGIQVLQQSSGSSALLHAMLALAQSHRQSAGDADGVETPYEISAEQELPNASPVDQITSRLLLAWRLCLTSSQESWYDEVVSLLTGPIMGSILLPEHQQLMKRLVLAAALSAPASSKALIELPLDLNGYPTALMQPATSIYRQQLGFALHLLERSLFFTPMAGSNRKRFPLQSAWQACWSEVQLWYAFRAQELLPIIEIKGQELDLLGESNIADIPVLVFSSSYAAVSNLVHHLTSMKLLQHKPRLLKATAEGPSSASLIWHALRIVAILSNACDFAIWDPLAVVALTMAGLVFTHDAQRALVVELLEKASKIAGFHTESIVSRFTDRSPSAGSRSDFAPMPTLSQCSLNDGTTVRSIVS